MGCSIAKDHPKNVELIKLKKKYDTQPIKEAQLVILWIIGADEVKTLELAKMIADKQGYLLLTEKSLLHSEIESGSIRGLIIDEILRDNGSISPDIIDNLVVETLFTKLEGIHGVVFNGIPHNKEQAYNLQRSVGPASLVIYCELKGEELKRALIKEGDDGEQIKMKVERFQKSVIQLSKHKNTMKIDGEADPSSILDACIQKLTEVEFE